MSTQDPRRAPAAPALTALPQAHDLPIAAQGYDRARVEEAFDAFRRHVTALQAQLRVLQAAPRGAAAEPSGHAVRMDALHLVRAAAEFADTIERDAQEAATKQIARAEKEIRERQLDSQQQEAEIQRIRQETERQRVEIVNAARNEARELLARTNRESSQELHEAEASGARLLEQARHQATELTNAARAEVEQTLEWARAQADVIVQRARMGAEQLLGAAGHGEVAVQAAVDAIARAAEETVQASRRPPRPAAPDEGRSEPEPESELIAEASGPGPVTAEPIPDASEVEKSGEADAETPPSGETDERSQGS
jgi:F0F1-type ATP synthase membrane subunit b/b'